MRPPAPKPIRGTPFAGLAPIPQSAAAASPPELQPAEAVVPGELAPIQQRLSGVDLVKELAQITMADVIDGVVLALAPGTTETLPPKEAHHVSFSGPRSAPGMAPVSQTLPQPQTQTLRAQGDVASEAIATLVDVSISESERSSAYLEDYDEPQRPQSAVSDWDTRGHTPELPSPKRNQDPLLELVPGVKEADDPVLSEAMAIGQMQQIPDPHVPPTADRLPGASFYSEEGGSVQNIIVLPDSADDVMQQAYIQELFREQKEQSARDLAKITLQSQEKDMLLEQLADALKAQRARCRTLEGELSKQRSLVEYKLRRGNGPRSKASVMHRNLLPPAKTSRSSAPMFSVPLVSDVFSPLDAVL